MSKDVWIVSGMTDSISYCFYREQKHPNDPPSIKESITIRGGRGLPSNRSGFGEQRQDAQGMPLWVADGIVTRISAEQFAKLESHPHFKRHLERGRLKVIKQNIEGNHKAVREVSRDMEGPDSHALLNKETAKLRVKVKMPEVESQENSFRF